MHRFPKRLGFTIKTYCDFLYPHVCLMSHSPDPPSATCFGLGHFRHGRYCQKWLCLSTVLSMYVYMYVCVCMYVCVYVCV